MHVFGAQGAKVIMTKSKKQALTRVTVGQILFRCLVCSQLGISEIANLSESGDSKSMTHAISVLYYCGKATT